MYTIYLDTANQDLSRHRIADALGRMPFTGPDDIGDLDGSHIFRSNISGWGKAGWTFFVIILPFLGVFVYLIANGDKMRERSAAKAAEAQAAQNDYIKSVADSGTSAADQLATLSNLHDTGKLTDEEFAAQKAKLLA